MWVEIGQVGVGVEFHGTGLIYLRHGANTVALSPQELAHLLFIAPDPLVDKLHGHYDRLVRDE